MVEIFAIQSLVNWLILKVIALAYGIIARARGLQKVITYNSNSKIRNSELFSFRDEALGSAKSQIMNSELFSAAACCPSQRTVILQLFEQHAATAVPVSFRRCSSGRL